MPSPAAKSKSPKSRTAPARPGGRAAAKQQSVIDDGARREIVGVALCVLGIALMVAVLSHNSGFAARAGAGALKMAFGIGAYVIPIFLVLWGISFFVRAEIHEGRTGLGLGIVGLAIISMAALTTPYAAFFDATAVLANHGGYVGGAVAWALYKSVGLTIGFVLLGGLLVVGLIITGSRASVSTALVRAARS